MDIQKKTAKMKKVTGASIAFAVALTFSSVTLSVSADQPIYKWVKCYGINECRGHSECKLTTNQCKTLNQCKGQNSCQGKGFVWKTPENCKAAGGSAPESPERMP